MKKILTIIIALTLVLVMTGCGSKWSNKENDTVSVMEGGTVYTQYYVDENYYTQDEVRDLIDSLIESSEYKIYVDVDFEMNKLEDELWETNKKVNRINERVLELEARIEELENPVIDEPLIPIYTQWIDEQLVFTMAQEPYTIILTVDKVYTNQVEMVNTYDIYSMTICGDYCETEVSVGIPNRYTGEEIILEMRDYMQELQELLEFFGGE